MKKIFRMHYKKILLAFMLIFALTFSACAYSNDPPVDNNGVSYIGNIDGFKATYRPESYPVDDYYSNYAQEIVYSLADIFGLANLPKNTGNEIDIVRTSYNNYLSNPANYETEPLTYEEYEDIYRVYFIDDIRNSIYLYNPSVNTFYSHSNVNYKWKWTINSTYYNGASPIAPHDFKVYFTEYFTHEKNASLLFDDLVDLQTERDKFYNYYSETYAQSLQVAILEILLGRPPTEFVYDYNIGTITPSASSLLPSLQSDYEKYTTYIGISKETDIPKITDYILKNVIGSQKFSETDSNNHFSEDDYETIINEIIWDNYLSEYYFSDSNGQNEELGSLYDIFPTNLIKDYGSNSFFISSIDKQNFAHIPSGEYQSLVMMPTEDNYLYEMWYFLVADRVLNIDVLYRYYDSATGNYYQSTPVTVQTQIESSFTEEKAQILSVNFYNSNNQETLFLTKPFNQEIGNGILKANTTKYMDYLTNQYYKTLPSVNGFGTVSVLDETAFVNDNSSFFEMVFDVHKDAENPFADYSFKVGMYSLFFASQSQINNYLLQNNN